MNMKGCLLLGCCEVHCCIGIHEFNQKRKKMMIMMMMMMNNSENGYFPFDIFPMLAMSPFFYQSELLMVWS